MIDSTERLKVLIYEYFFFNESKRINKIISLSNLCNYRKVDLELLSKLYNSKVEYDTFSEIMTDILLLFKSF